MAYIVMAYIVMAYIVMAYIVMAYIVMAYIVMVYIVMAYIVVTYIVMAYIVKAYIVTLRLGDAGTARLPPALGRLLLRHPALCPARTVRMELDSRALFFLSSAAV